jgi:hypothetical protein
MARDVSAALQKQIAASDRIIITAGESYCRHLVPLLETHGHEVCRPLNPVSQVRVSCQRREPPITNLSCGRW